MYKSLTIFSLIILFGSCKPISKDLEIVKKEFSDYRIIYADRAGDSIQQAIKLFQQNLKLVTGADILSFSDIVGEQPKEILIGKSKRTEKYLKSIPLDSIGSGYFAGTRDDKWIIIANSGEATTNALYDILNKLGCVKLVESMTQLSKHRTLVIPGKDVVFNPSFDYRQVINPHALNKDYRAWNRINIDNQNDWGTWEYSMERILPSESYFKSNPEFFATVNGVPNPNQINFLNSAMSTTMEKNMDVWSMAKGRAQFWSISPYANHIVSEDELTKKAIEETGSSAGALLKTVNAIAEKNKARTYAIWLDGPYRKAPKNSIPAKNVMIVLDTKDANQAMSLGEGAKNEAFRKDLESWKSITSNIAVVQHVTNETNFMLPHPNLNAMQKSFIYLHGQGVRKIILNGLSGPGSALADLKFYVGSNLAWDAHQNLDSLIWRYCDNFYGQGAKSMFGFVQALEKSVMSSKAHMDLNGTAGEASRSWLSPNSVNQLYSFFNATNVMIQNNSELRSKIDRARLSLIYAQLEVAKNMGTKTFGYFMNLGALSQQLVRQDQPVVKKNEENLGIKLAQWSSIQGMKDLIDKFVTDCETEGIRVINANGLTPQEYKIQLLKYINQKIQTHTGFKKGSIILNSVPDPRFADGDASILNDGATGIEESPTTNWVGLPGENGQLTWNLDTLLNPRTVNIRFMQHVAEGAWLPATVSIQTSMDGINFTEAAGKSIASTEAPVTISNVSLPLPAKPFKALKLMVSGKVICPANHKKAGSKASILLDEIVLN